MNRRSLLRLTLAGPLWLSGTSAMAARSPASKPGKTAKPPVVMLDPGHGGRDPGAIGSKGLYEKRITLEIAKETARLLARTKRAAVFLTREDDRFLSLRERIDIATQNKADLFLSIHADSAPNRQARGLSAYTLSEKATDDFAAAIAARENIVDGAQVPPSDDVAAILADLSVRHARSAALRAKRSLIEGAGRDLALLENPMRSANFAVLKAPTIPSLLIETGFLSNPSDEALLSDPAARRRIAAILSRELADLLAAPPFA
jgi:N-acetylmuramoyl-L-alanine amidase